MKTIDISQVAAALLYGSMESVVRPFMLAAEAKLGSRAFRRAGIKADDAKPVKAAAGSGTVNVRSLLDWVASIDPKNEDDKQNVEQLRSLVATVNQRMGVTPEAKPKPGPLGHAETYMQHEENLRQAKIHDKDAKATPAPKDAHGRPAAPAAAKPTGKPPDATYPALPVTGGAKQADGTQAGSAQQPDDKSRTESRQQEDAKKDEAKQQAETKKAEQKGRR